MDVMFNLELQRLEGVWTGTEQVSDGVNHYSSSGRLVFQTVFDGRFLLCDYVQTAPERPTAFAHGVFRQDERSKALTVTWFRSPTPDAMQKAISDLDGKDFEGRTLTVKVADERRSGGGPRMRSGRESGWGRGR
jgi:hypothetical protein